MELFASNWRRNGYETQAIPTKGVMRLEIEIFKYEHWRKTASRGLPQNAVRAFQVNREATFENVSFRPKSERTNHAITVVLSVLTS